MRVPDRDEERTRTLTLEAFADVIVPGEKRFPGDRSVAGAAPGPGAVAAGALELLNTPATGINETLDYLVDALNVYAAEYAADGGLNLDDDVPEFVALPFEDRTAIVTTLVAPDNAEKEAWIGLALFSNMAFDSAAHLHTAEALAAGHPGLLTIGLTPPDPDGLWRFPNHSYGRALADTHPETTRSGSLA